MAERRHFGQSQGVVWLDLTLIPFWNIFNYPRRVYWTIYSRMVFLQCGSSSEMQNLTVSSGNGQRNTAESYRR